MSLAIQKEGAGQAHLPGEDLTTPLHRGGGGGRGWYTVTVTGSGAVGSVDVGPDPGVRPAKRRKIFPSTLISMEKTGKL